jgi:hypothetical protein
MAIRAQKNALARLSASRINRSRDTSLREPECLLLGVQVMELECRNAAGVPTDGTASAGLRHEDVLDASASASDGVAATLQAAIALGVVA